jgi:hypothetical protein
MYVTYRGPMGIAVIIPCSQSVIINGGTHEIVCFIMQA